MKEPNEAETNMRNRQRVNLPLAKLKTVIQHSACECEKCTDIRVGIVVGSAFAGAPESIESPSITSSNGDRSNENQMPILQDRTRGLNMPDLQEVGMCEMCNETRTEVSSKTVNRESPSDGSATEIVEWENLKANPTIERSISDELYSMGRFLYIDCLIAATKVRERLHRDLALKVSADGETSKSADQLLIEALRLDVLRARNAHSKAEKRIQELEGEVERQKKRAFEWHTSAIFWHRKATGEITPMDFEAIKEAALGKGDGK